MIDTFIGFDSAWTDNPKAPGAIAAVSMTDDAEIAWHEPRLVSFEGALAFIRDRRASDGVTLLALDQPTIVRNPTGMRPVERAAASVISFSGGGVQPSNTGRIGMFCAASPVWRFLGELGATEDPEAAREATTGLFLTEVFPALALLSLHPGFFGRLAAPRYNPGRRSTFRPVDWLRVAEAAATEAASLGCPAMANWCRGISSLARPTKSDQDRLDAALCTLVALRWRRRPRSASIMLGDRDTGYILAPASPEIRERLAAAARRFGVPIDGLTL